MWNPQRLTTLWAFTACYRDSLTLSLQITHGVFFSQPNSFLAIILQLLIPKTRLSTIPSSYPHEPASRNSTLHSRLLFSSLLYYRTLNNHFARTVRKTAYLPRRCLAVDVILSRTLARGGMYLPSRCLAMGIHVTMFNSLCDFDRRNPV
jgi:hypothetical protein